MTIGSIPTSRQRNETVRQAWAEMVLKQLVTDALALLARSASCGPSGVENMLCDMVLREVGDKPPAAPPFLVPRRYIPQEEAWAWNV